MRGLLTILTFILCQMSFGQFGIIADKDGFVNVRNSPAISNNISNTLPNGHIVFCWSKDGEWLLTNYQFKGQDIGGYIHKSRVKLINNFDEIACDNIADTTIMFKKDSIKLLITKREFNPKNHRLQYHEEDTSGYLEKIDGKETWGTDGNIPKYQYGQIALTIGKETIYLPIDNLYEPNFDYTTVHVDEDNRTIYLSAENSDAAGAYAVLWIVENGAFKQRVITIPF